MRTRILLASVAAVTSLAIASPARASSPGLSAADAVGTSIRSGATVSPAVRATTVSQWVAGSATPTVVSAARLTRPGGIYPLRSAVRPRPVASAAACLTRPTGVFYLPKRFRPQPDWSYYYYSEAPFTKCDVYHQFPLSFDQTIIKRSLQGWAPITRSGDYVQYNLEGAINGTAVCYQVGGLIQRPPGKPVALYITHRFANPGLSPC